MAFLIILAGFLPSLLWLKFYLRKDLHPEPRRLLIETFFLAILLAPLAITAQWLFSYFVEDSTLFFLWAASVEEVVKFLAVFYLIIHNAEFNEPVDAMIYLITAALGFAAIENALMLYKNIDAGSQSCVLGLANLWCILGLRTIGATLVHALASGLAGYFLALAWFYRHHSKKLIVFGLVLATVVHFVFNLTLLHLDPVNGLFSSSILLAGMLILISILFTKLKERSPSRLSTVPDASQ